MTEIYEIRYPTGAIVQRVDAMTDAERTTLEARGYKVRRHSVSPGTWPWLLGQEPNATEGELRAGERH